MARIYTNIRHEGRIPKGQPGAGRFTSAGASSAFRAQMRDANERMAREQQAEVIDQMRGSIKRRQVSSGRLLAVTADPKNIEVSDSHFGVGVEGFLNGSMAKYWRTIEEGSATTWADTPGGRSGMRGMVLKGLWGGSIGLVTADRVYGARPWSRHSATRRDDIFVPGRQFREQGRFAKAPSGTGGKGGLNLVGTTVVKNEIDPHWDYRDAFRVYGPGRRAFDEVNRLLAAATRGAWDVQR